MPQGPEGQPRRPDAAAHSDRLAHAAERLRDAAVEVRNLACRHGDRQTASRITQIAESIEREHGELAAMQQPHPAAPPPDSSAANAEPSDAVEEASLESFPASDPPATRNHSH